MPKVRVSDSAHKEIDLLRGNKTQKDFIDMLINRYKKYDTLKKKLHQKDLEIERLRGQKPATPYKSRSYTDSCKPVACLRNLRIFPTNRQVACHEHCKFKYPVEYRACQETKAERSIQT